MTAPTPLHGTPHALAQANAGAFRPGFIAWLGDNLHVWIAFKREADRIWNRGRRHYSARTIIHYLRHETALQSNDDDDWKINNNVSPDLARLYLLLHPDRTDFFELRTQSNSERAA